MTIAARSQTTLASSAAVTGRGYWSGKKCRVEFRPAPIDSGITFVRDDLGPSARIPLHIDAQRSTPRRTVLQAGDAVVEMVEHVAAALAGLGVDNCDVGVNTAELPGMDGSSVAFVNAIEDARLTRQEAAINPLVITKPVRCEAGDTWIEARPPTHGCLSIEFNLDFGPEAIISPQWMVLDIDSTTFRTDLAVARTFLLKSEADLIQAQGLALHVTTSDLLIFDDSTNNAAPLENTLRYPDECVRHKMLDVLGDLALAGRPIVGRIVACRSGHQLNGELVRQVLASESGEEITRRSA